MGLIRWLLILPFSFILTLVNYMFAPIIALFVNKTTHKLPCWLSWFDTPDSLMNGYKGDMEFYEQSKTQSAWWTYTKWLWRNPTNGFDESSVAARLVNGGSLKCIGKYNISNRKPNAQSGAYLIYGDGWELYVVLQYATLPVCFRMRLGWKLREAYEKKQFMSTQYVWAIAPVMRFEGDDHE